MYFNVYRFFFFNFFTSTDCQSLYSTASRNGLLLSSNLTLSGTVVWLACDHTDQRIDGHSRLTCRNGTWSSGLPQCA
ncbi:sushi, von Willebrand factor type A, EGF and pentraxin domain-containing protein 1, partial [Biomphalaria glabrata]